MVVEVIEVGRQQRVDVLPTLDVEVDGGHAVPVALLQVLLDGGVLFVRLDLRGLRGRQRLTRPGGTTIIHRRHRPREERIGRQSIGGSRPGDRHGAGKGLQGRRQGVARRRVSLHHGGQRVPRWLHGARAREGKLRELRILRARNAGGD